MKDTVIKFRLPSRDKNKIERFAEQHGKSVSAILRTALLNIQEGTQIGQIERQTMVDARHSANALLHFFQTGMSDRKELEFRLRKMRDDAQRVLSS